MPLRVELTDVVMLGDVELTVLATEILDCKETGGVDGVEVETVERLFSTFSCSDGSDDPIIALRDSVFPLIRKFIPSTLNLN